MEDEVKNTNIEEEATDSGHKKRNPSTSSGLKRKVRSVKSTDGVVVKKKRAARPKKAEAVVLASSAGTSTGSVSSSGQVTSTDSTRSQQDDEEEFEIKINIKGKPSAAAVASMMAEKMMEPAQPAVETPQQVIEAQKETVMSAVEVAEAVSMKPNDIKEDIIAKSEEIAKKIEAAEEVIKEAPATAPVAGTEIGDDILASKGGKVRDLIAQEMKKDSLIPPVDSEQVFMVKKGLGAKIKSLFKRKEKVEKAEERVEVKAVMEEEFFKPNHSRSLKLYKRIAYFFLVSFVIVAVGVFYFSYVKVKIVLIPNQERVSNNLIFDVYDQDNATPKSDNSVTGIVREIEISQDKKYEATGKELIGQEVSGKVSILNSYNKNQPLVASTRLMSADGKIFRLKNTINVPAGGSLSDVEIYADEPRQEMAIGPSKFVIPGLWAGLQDKIYAESKEAFIYGEKNNKHVLQVDIDNGMRDIRQVLLDKAKEEVNKSYSDYSNIIYNIVDNTVASKVDAKADEEKNDFTISIKANVLVVAFNNAAAATIAKQKLAASLPENKELVSFDDKNIVYALNDYNSSSKTATVNASFEGKVGIKDGVQVVDKEKLIGLNKDQLDAYLNSVDDLAGHEVIFYPSFIKKIPSVIEPGKIEIEVRK